jgi:thioredoxin 1
LSETEEFNDKIYFAKVDVDEVQDLAQELGVRAMPTFFFFKDGEKTDTVVGADPNKLVSSLKAVLG